MISDNPGHTCHPNQLSGPSLHSVLQENAPEPSQHPRYLRLDSVLRKNVIPELHESHTTGLLSNQQVILARTPVANDKMMEETARTSNAFDAGMPAQPKLLHKNHGCESWYEILISPGHTKGGQSVRILTPNRVLKLLGVCRGGGGRRVGRSAAGVPLGGLMGTPTYIPQKGSP